MASLKIKSKTNANNRAMLNTTIDPEVLEAFKSYCKEIGYPMNMILESFMKQFVTGEFCLKIGKNNRLNVAIEEDDEIEVSEEQEQE